MGPLEDFRAYLVRRLALQLGIPVENRTAWEIWVSIHDEYPEAARIASDQWLKQDLLAEHLLYHDHVRNLKDTANSDLVTQRVYPELAGYLSKWQQFNARIRIAIAKRHPPKFESFISN
jgi:hypothetical protein